MKKKIKKEKGMANPYYKPEEKPTPNTIVRLIGNRLMRALKDEMNKIETEMAV